MMMHWINQSDTVLMEPPFNWTALSINKKCFIAFLIVIFKLLANLSKILLECDSSALLHGWKDCCVALNKPFSVIYSKRSNRGHYNEDDGGQSISLRDNFEGFLSDAMKDYPE